MTLRVGVIGAGVMGAEHARLLREETRGAILAAVCDADPDRAKAVAGSAVPLSDPLALIAHPDVEAVVIASPDATHADLALACIAAGKPVLCEKPLGISGTESLRVVEAEVRSGRPLVQVGYMRRFDPAYCEMRDAARDQSLGPAMLLHNVHRNKAAPAWFAGAMPLTNSFVHEIDISRWMLGEEFVQGSINTADGGEPMMITLRSDAGHLVSTELFMNCGYGYHVHAELVCTRGSVAMAQPALTVRNTDGRHGHAFPDNWVPRFAEAYRRQMEAFVRFATTGINEGATAWDGYVATALAEQLIPALDDTRPVTFTLAATPT